MLKTPISIALAQILVIDSDWDGNFTRVERALATLEGQDVDLVVFPESAILGWVNPDAHQMATPIPGSDADRLKKLAIRYRRNIVIGLDEKAGDALFDSAIFINHAGEIVWRHRKILTLEYLIEPPYSSGTAADIGVFDTEFGQVGILICADTFDEASVNRMRELGPELLVVPYGWAAEPNEWPNHAESLHTLVKKLGRELQCLVVGVNSVGAISKGPWRGKTYGGGSIAVDAKGHQVAILADRDVEIRVIQLG
jgi:N-carbamoylputrescine amidase